MRLIRSTLIFVLTIIYSSVALADFSDSSTPKFSDPRGGVNTGATAPAERVMKLTDNTKLEKLLFKFGNAEASLVPNGSWFIKGQVKHNRIRCATYQLGVRFGVGEKGCTNVSWIGDFEYGTNEKHCNSATLQHTGGGLNDLVVGSVEQVTCAEVKVRCFGKTCNK